MTSSSRDQREPSPLQRLREELFRRLLECDFDRVLRECEPLRRRDDPLRLVLRCERDPLLPLEDFFGTFAPSRRASESPMAIACLRLVTFFPLRPLFSLPRFISRISVRTLFCARGPYFLPPDRPLDERCDDELLLVAMNFSLQLLGSSAGSRGCAKNAQSCPEGCRARIPGTPAASA